MPEYLAPGVFVEETSFRNKSIEGVGTSVAALVGPTRIKPPPGLSRRLASAQSSGLNTLAMNWQLASARGTRAMLATIQVSCGARRQARFTASREISRA